jgi:RNA polymerase sigma-70 factor (ECF subfamily)
MTDVATTVSRLAKEEGGRLVALLAHRFGDLGLADESVQDALVEALGWSVIPDQPVAWLHTVARNRAIDRIRRTAARSRRETDAARQQAGLNGTGAEEPRMIVEHSDVGDEHLRLVLLCCHPALDRDAQVALTLRLVGGLSTAEIAAAFLTSEATLAQRIVRAKRKIRDARIPLTIPAQLAERVDAVLRVLYLIFNEGYLSRGAADGARGELVEDAIRLTIQLRELLPDDAEVGGLLALELYTRARADARFDGGELVLLEEQDRTRWDLELIEQANGVLAHAMTRGRPGPFQLQAIIAQLHANARTAADTDWPAIASAYGVLEAMTRSSIVSLNRAVAVGMADGPRAGLVLLDAITGLEGYHLYWAVRGELLFRAGGQDAALPALLRARELAENPAEQRHLDKRIARVRR